MTTLLEQVKAELLRRKGSWRRIADDLDGVIGYEWLTALMQGHINDPGFLKIQALHDYLFHKGSSNAKSSD